MRTFAQKPKKAKSIKSAKAIKPGWTLSRQSREVHSILHLRRTIGNQAVQRLLQGNAEELKGNSTTPGSTRFGHDFSRIPLHAEAHSKLQPKLSISNPGDLYEQEANRVADQVMRMPEHEIHKPCLAPTVSPSFAPGIPSAIRTMQASGRPLSHSQRKFYEPRFGVDFSAVRLHRGERAAALARRYSARAFTFGRDIVLGRRSGDLDSDSGRALLAHELTHVAQQMGGSPMVQRKEEPWSISPDPTEDQRVDALVAAFKERLAMQDAESLLRIQQIFESAWRGRELVSRPAAIKQRPALTKEAILTEGLTGRMVRHAGEDLTRILGPVGIFLGIWDNKLEAKEALADLPKEGADAGLVELYESLPGLHTPPPGPQQFASLGTELTALETWPFPLSIKPKIEVEIPKIPEKRPHRKEPRLWVGPNKAFRPGQEILVRVTAEKGSWIYLVVPKNPKAHFQTGDDTLAADPKLLAYPAHNSDFSFAAPKEPGNYQVQLVSWEEEILARQEIFVPLVPYRP